MNLTCLHYDLGQRYLQKEVMLKVHFRHFLFKQKKNIKNRRNILIELVRAWRMPRLVQFFR